LSTSCASGETLQNRGSAEEQAGQSILRLMLAKCAGNHTA
jgi:hypothetical protein